jgi:hypothetical protein
MSKPSNNPFVQQLDLLMSGYGYNFYDHKNQARADDLLVRQRATKSLNEGAEAIARLEGEYQRRYIPPATRENPYPSPETLNKLQDLSRLRERFRELGARILGMPVPTQDKVWWRFRDEAALLNQLIQFDYQMVQQTEQLYQQASSLTPDLWQHGGEAVSLAGALQHLEMLIRDRQNFLQRPV